MEFRWITRRRGVADRRRTLGYVEDRAIPEVDKARRERRPVARLGAHFPGGQILPLLWSKLIYCNPLRLQLQQRHLFVDLLRHAVDALLQALSLFPDRLDTLLSIYSKATELIRSFSLRERAPYSLFQPHGVMAKFALLVSVKEPYEVLLTLIL